MFALQHELQLCYGSEGIAKIRPLLDARWYRFPGNATTLAQSKRPRNEEPVSRAPILFGKH
jgi:hypothetical protein